MKSLCVAAAGYWKRWEIYGVLERVPVADIGNFSLCFKTVSFLVYSL